MVAFTSAVTVQFDGIALMCAKAPHFNPVLLLCHHCECQHNEKVKECLGITMKMILTSSRPPEGSLGLPGVCRPYFFQS